MQMLQCQWQMKSWKGTAGTCAHPDFLWDLLATQTEICGSPRIACDMTAQATRTRLRPSPQ
jgi:hypothetical protein